MGKAKKDNFSSEFLWKNSGGPQKAVEVIKSMMQWMLEVKNALMMLIAVVLKVWLMVFGTLPSKDQTRRLVVLVDSRLNTDQLRIHLTFQHGILKRHLRPIL